MGDAEPSESDTDSANTPAGSPSHMKTRNDDKNRLSTQSFGLHSPDGLGPSATDIQVQWKIIHWFSHSTSEKNLAVLQ